MRRHLRATTVAVLLGFALGCASFGIGMDTKPEGAKERFIAAMVDYEIVLREVGIMVDGWAVAAEQGDPLTPVYVDASDRIDRIRIRAREIITQGIAALAQEPLPVHTLEAVTRVLTSLTFDLQAELLAGKGS